MASYFEIRQYGWNSCLLLLANLALIVLYAVAPRVPFNTLLNVISAIALLGIFNAVISLVRARFWISKMYAACGLLGNLCLPLWLVLTFASY